MAVTGTDLSAVAPPDFLARAGGTGIFLPLARLKKC
jgi:hypothetical protein